MKVPALSIAKDKIDKSFPVSTSHRLAAIAFTSNGHIVARATNRIVLGNPEKFSIHAEEFLIRKLIRIKAKERFGKLFILVARWSIGEQRWKIAKPCRNCQKMIERYGIREIFFTDRNGEVQRESIR